MNGPLGLSPIDQMRDAIGEGIAAQSYALHSSRTTRGQAFG
jgi:hypothetical protein